MIKKVYRHLKSLCLLRIESIEINFYTSEMLHLYFHLKTNMNSTIIITIEITITLEMHRNIS